MLNSNNQKLFKLKFFLILILFTSCNNGHFSTVSEFENLPDATFVGKQACTECHESAFINWEGSDHDNAMDTAITKTVRGDFNNAELEFDGFITKFYKRNERFFVYTKGPEGKPDEFEISYTFGVRPLQQYLIAFGKGRLQCLPYAWDTENNEWYYLNDRVYHGLEIPPDDWLYWTNNGQNWNSMCAECHSTNLKVDYDLETREFHTIYSEIDVSCEACHGPASNHVIWSEIEEGERPEVPFYGLVRKSVGLSTEELIDQCAYCHARRSSITDNGTTGDAYLNHFIPQLISSTYYHPDGQIKDEDYVFGSFTQSRMHNSYVKCTDCHEPHNLKTKQQGNLLCLQCHEWKDYDTENHHFHKKTGIDSDTVLTQNGFYNKGDGTQCVDCHMTGGIYMGADFRRDHSIRVPRPDVGQKTSSPDACTGCHKDKNTGWAMESLKAWYPDFNDSTHYGELFLASENGDYSSMGGLKKLINDTGTADMVKAAAIEHLSYIPNMEGRKILEKHLNDTLSLVRLAATRNYFSPDANSIVKQIGPGLSDDLLAIRIVAAQQFMAIENTMIDSMYLSAFKNAETEYLDFQKRTAYFASSRYNLGVYYTRQNKVNKAINEFKTALKIDNQYFPAMVNLALIYSKAGDNVKAEKWLKITLNKDPDNRDALRYMGLLKAEQKKLKEAAFYLEKAVVADPGNARLYYNLGIIYQQTNNFKKAEQSFINALKLYPNNYDYLYGLGYFYLQTDDRVKAIKVADKLIQLYPNREAGHYIRGSIQ